MADNRRTFNMLIVGGTGVGKSTIINYLLPDLETPAVTGVGAPVTQRGFHKYTGEISGVTVNCYDSMGLEVDKYKEWQKDLNKKLSDHSSNKSPKEWLNIILYLIDASGCRVQQGDLDILGLIKKENYSVSVVFTKSDCISEEESKKLHTEIEKEYPNIRITDVCSIEKETRSGTTKRFGKDQLEEIILYEALANLKLNLPKYINEEMKNIINNSFESCEMTIEKDVSWLTLQDEISMVQDKIEKKMRHDFDMAVKYGNFLFETNISTMMSNIASLIPASDISFGKNYDTEYKQIYKEFFGDGNASIIGTFAYKLGKSITYQFTVPYDLINNFINDGKRNRDRLRMMLKDVKDVASSSIDQFTAEIETIINDRMKCFLDIKE